MRLVMPGCLKDINRQPWVRVLAWTLFMTLYLTFGALVFQQLEGQKGQPDEQRAWQVQKYKLDFMRDHPCVSVPVLN